MQLPCRECLPFRMSAGIWLPAAVLVQPLALLPASACGACLSHSPRACTHTLTHQVMGPGCKIYALKRIRLQGRDAEAARGFVDEIALLKRLRNRPNIIQLVDWQVGGRHWAVRGGGGGHWASG